jgi:WD40 repeat protein
MDYNIQLNHLAVGNNEGTITIRQVQNLAEYATSGKEDTVNLDTVVCTLNHPREWVEEIRYSPDGKKLAVGSHDNYIYLYSTAETGGYKSIGKCKGHSSYITCIDWSLDCNIIRTVCGAYELLFFDTNSAK